MSGVLVNLHPTALLKGGVVDMVSALLQTSRDDFCVWTMFGDGVWSPFEGHISIPHGTIVV
jgi:hypothetical protein